MITVGIIFLAVALAVAAGNQVAQAVQRKRVARGYIRVSTDEQAKKHSPDEQRAVILAYYEYRLKPQGYEWGGFYEDPGVSGSIAFCSREAGGRLMLDAQDGDAILFSKLDRGFRSTQDALVTNELCKQRKITTHFLDLGVDTSTYIGEFFLTVLAAFAQMERERLRDRIKEGWRRRRLKGLPHKGGHPPYGFKWQGPAGRKRLVPDEYTRTLGKKLLELAEMGHSLEQIYWWLIRNNILRRDANKRPKGKGHYSILSISKMVKREKALQVKEAKQAAEITK